MNENQEKPKILKREITNEIIEQANKQGRRVTAEELGIKEGKINLTEEERENLDINNE